MESTKTYLNVKTLPNAAISPLVSPVISINSKIFVYLHLAGLDRCSKVIVYLVCMRISNMDGVAAVMSYTLFYNIIITFLHAFIGYFEYYCTDEYMQIQLHTWKKNGCTLANIGGVRSPPPRIP